MNLPDGARPRIAIFTDEPGWHGARLRGWFTDHGADAHYISLSDCDIDLAASGSGFHIGPFGTTLPDGTLGREYWKHMTTVGFGFPGEPAGIPLPVAYHDVAHVLAEHAAEGVPDHW